MATSALPFDRVLVPYDGSEPARAALGLALRLAARGARLTIVNVIDDMPLIAQSASSMLVFDSTPAIDGLDEHGSAVLDEATTRSRAAGVTPTRVLVHDTPVSGIAAALAEYPSDLIVMGTHARPDLARAIMGSTTEGVLHAVHVPVLTVRPGHDAADPFVDALVAVDDSEPADAAVATALRLARTNGMRFTLCHAVNLTRFYDTAVGFGFAPDDLGEELHRAGSAVLRRAVERAQLPADAPTLLVDGVPADAVIEAAGERGVTLIVAGTHGRRGLRRFILGSVAENIVRHSNLPVLVVHGAPAASRGADAGNTPP